VFSSLKKMNTKNHFRRAFDFVDKDKDGNIDATELGAIFALVGEPKSVSELNALLAEADVDKSGALSFDEFLLIVEKARQQTLEHEVEVYFNELDTGGKGYLSAERVKVKAVGFWILVAW
jgi:Ca2+-binding EF-hand superfamily protein